MNLRKKNSHIFICNGKSWNIKNYFELFVLTYKAIQTRPPVLLVDSPYKSCIAPPSDPPQAC